MDYLGFIVSKDGLAPQPDKVATIKNMTSPQSKRIYKCFLEWLATIDDLLLILVKLLSIYFICEKTKILSYGCPIVN